VLQRHMDVAWTLCTRQAGSEIGGDNIHVVVFFKVCLAKRAQITVDEPDLKRLSKSNGNVVFATLPIINQPPSLCSRDPGGTHKK